MRLNCVIGNISGYFPICLAVYTSNYSNYPIVVITGSVSCFMICYYFIRNFIIILNLVVL